MRAIVTGMIASYPVDGVAWDYGQYALGLDQLGELAASHFASGVVLGEMQDALRVADRRQGHR